MSSLSDFPRRGSSGFQQVVAAFLAVPGLPFAGVLPAGRIEEIFVKHGYIRHPGYVGFRQAATPFKVSGGHPDVLSLISLDFFRMETPFGIMHLR